MDDDTKEVTNTEKWPLKCEVCRRKIPKKGKYIEVMGSFISCGDGDCTQTILDGLNGE